MLSLSRIVFAAFLAAPLAFSQELPRDSTKLYAQLCASCHGQNWEGALGGSLSDGVWKFGDGGDAHLAKVIAQGLPENGMPPFGAVLDPSRIRALSVLIHEKEIRAKEKGTDYAKPAENQIVRSKAATFRIETVASGLNIPWSIAFLPGTKDILVAEKDGRLLVLRDGKLPPEPVAGTPKVWAKGQGGLMIVAPHPDYAKPGNGWLYLAFSDPGENDEAMTAIVRGRIHDGKWTDEQDIFRAPKNLYKRGGVHFGTRLVFDQGYLFFGIGERGAKENAQSLDLPNGKIHRIHDDGRVPADNPFNFPNSGAFPTIWSYGHRNPQGLAARPGTTGDTLQIWETEHGPRGGDELNLIKRGANFGWPLITYGMDYNGTPISADTAREGLEQPATYWTPSIAVCGLAFYDGDRIPAWKGDLFTGSLAQQELRRIVLDGDTVKSQEVLFRGIGRIRAVQMGPDGLLYVTLEGPGRIVRLVPAE